MDIGRLIQSATAGLGQLPTPPPDAPVKEAEADRKTAERLHSAPKPPQPNGANFPATAPSTVGDGELPPPNSKLTVGLADFRLLKILGYVYVSIAYSWISDRVRAKSGDFQQSLVGFAQARTMEGKS